MRTSVFAIALVAACRAAPDPPAPKPLPPVAAVVEIATTTPPESFGERVARVHAAAVIVDGHDDIPTVMANTGFDLGKPNGKTATDLPKMKAGGITAEFFSIFVDRSYAEHPTSAGGSTLRVGRSI